MQMDRMVGNLGGPLDLGGGDHRTKAEKVAILLASLDKAVAVELLKRFDPEDVKRIVESSGRLGSLNSRDVEPLIDEFSAEFSEALGISAGSAEIVSLMEQAFTSKEVASIMGQEEPHPEDAVWPKFKAGSEKSLVPYLLDEHEQTAAVVLSKLGSDLAARCIAVLPRGSATRIVSRMLGLGEVSPAALRDLEDALRDDFFGKSAAQDNGARVDRMAAVVNRLEREQSAQILEDVSKLKPEEVKTLRKLIFMFEDIEQLSQPSRLKLFDRVPTELVIPALYATEPSFREAVLSSLGARARRMVESELQDDTSAPHKDTAQARRKIADIAIQMSRAGDIQLLEKADQPEEAKAAS
jgi:flagellar motor switch protein FliG